MFKRFRQWRAKRKVTKLVTFMITSLQKEGLPLQDSVEVVKDLLNASLAGMDNTFVAELCRARIVEKRARARSHLHSK